jgi:hypothetical protein
VAKRRAASERDAHQDLEGFYRVRQMWSAGHPPLRRRPDDLGVYRADPPQVCNRPRSSPRLSASSAAWRFRDGAVRFGHRGLTRCGRNAVPQSGAPCRPSSFFAPESLRTIGRTPDDGTPCPGKNGAEKLEVVQAVQDFLHAHNGGDHPPSTDGTGHHQPSRVVVSLRFAAARARNPTRIAGRPAAPAHRSIYPTVRNQPDLMRCDNRRCGPASHRVGPANQRRGQPSTEAGARCGPPRRPAHLLGTLVGPTGMGG